MSKPNTLNENLISYWSFDNANDIHRENNGTVGGATSGQTGIINDCYYFDGVDDYITGNAFLNEQTKGSISCWFKTDNLASNGVLFYHGDSVVGSTNACLFLYVRSANGDISFRLRRNGGFGYQQATTNSFDDDEWHHVVITYDGNGINGSYKCYVDNNLENFPTVVDNDENIGWFKDSSDTQEHTEYRFGSWNRTSGADIWFKGYIDELGIWNRALTEKEITELYNSGNGLEYNKFRYGNI